MTKVRIRVGAMEVEYEGEAEFLATGFHELLERVQELSAKGLATNPGLQISELIATPSTKNETLQMTVKTIATKINASSGPDLALAAICSLNVGKGMAKSKRAEILAEMKGATGIYNPNMSKNLSKYLRSLLTDGKIVEAETEVYALTPATETTLRRQLESQ